MPDVTHGAADKNWFLDMIEAVEILEMAKGYRLSMGRHSTVYL